jgi:hypothetical protein
VPFESVEEDPFNPAVAEPAQAVAVEEDEVRVKSSMMKTEIMMWRLLQRLSQRKRRNIKSPSQQLPSDAVFILG